MRAATDAPQTVQNALRDLDDRLIRLERRFSGLDSVSSASLGAELAILRQAIEAGDRIPNFQDFNDVFVGGSNSVEPTYIRSSNGVILICPSDATNWPPGEKAGPTAPIVEYDDGAVIVDESVQIRSAYQIDLLPGLQPAGTTEEGMGGVYVHGDLNVSGTTTNTATDTRELTVDAKKPVNVQSRSQIKLLSNHAENSTDIDDSAVIVDHAVTIRAKDQIQLMPGLESPTTGEGGVYVHGDLNVAGTTYAAQFEGNVKTQLLGVAFSSGPGNVGTAETDLAGYSWSIPANSFGVGESMHIHGVVIAAANTNTKTVRLDIAGVKVTVWTSAANVANHVGNFDAFVIRRTTTTGAISGFYLKDSAAAGTPTVILINAGLSAINWTITQAAKITGQATTDNDIRIADFNVNWIRGNGTIK